MTGLKAFIPDIKTPMCPACFLQLNITLVNILKHDWPGKWKTFIPDIVSASKTSETLCENTMRIFKLLSEEVFDFSRLDLTQVRGRLGGVQTLINTLLQGIRRNLDQGCTTQNIRCNRCTGLVL